MKKILFILILIAAFSCKKELAQDEMTYCYNRTNTEFEAQIKMSDWPVELDGIMSELGGYAREKIVDGCVFNSHGIIGIVEVPEIAKLDIDDKYILFRYLMGICNIQIKDTCMGDPYASAQYGIGFVYPGYGPHQITPGVWEGIARKNCYCLVIY